MKLGFQYSIFILCYSNLIYNYKIGGEALMDGCLGSMLVLNILVLAKLEHIQDHNAIIRQEYWSSQEKEKRKRVC